MATYGKRAEFDMFIERQGLGAGPAAAGPMFGQPTSAEMPFCPILAPRLPY